MNQKESSWFWANSSDALWHWMKDVYLRVGGERLCAALVGHDQMFLPTLIPRFPELKDLFLSYSLSVHISVFVCVCWHGWEFCCVHGMLPMVFLRCLGLTETGNSGPAFGHSRVQ